MEHELKRQTKVNMICGCVPLVIGLIALLTGEILAFVILSSITVACLINEIRRSKDPVLTFDEKCFSIGEKQYGYEDIEKISSFYLRPLHITFSEIIINGRVVCKFSSDYKNVREFAKQLTLNGVDHNIFTS